MRNMREIDRKYGSTDVFYKAFETRKLGTIIEKTIK